jgi:hypothetical protein
VLHILEKIRNSIKSNPMPSRWIIVVIVLFWAVMASWLFFREILPGMSSDEPLLYSVDAADEYRSHQGLVPRTFWSVERNGTEAGRTRRYTLRTTVFYDEGEDQFEIQGLLMPIVTREKENERELVPFGVHARNVRMQSSYWVNRSGNLVSLNMNTKYELLSTEPDLEPSSVSFDIIGKPRSGNFAPTVTNVGKKTELELDPVPVTGHSCVLNPLHPVQRIQNLRPGQTWSCAVVDPFCLDQASVLVPQYSLVKSLQPSVDAPERLTRRTLQGLVFHVAPETVNLRQEQFPKPEEPNQRVQVFEFPCRLLTCGEEGSLFWFQTWVNVEDGSVIKQEAHLWGETWTMIRLTPPGGRSSR